MKTLQNMAIFNSNYHFHCFLFVLILISCGCKKENGGDCFKSTGPTVKESRETAVFSGILVEDNINVFLSLGSKQEIIVEGGKNLIPLIKTEVTDGRLNIRNDNRCNWVRSYSRDVNVYITASDIRDILHYGYGNINSKGVLQTDSIFLTVESNGDINLEINVNYMICNIRGSSDIILRGYAERNGFWADGNSFLRFSELETGSTYLMSHTYGDCFVNAKEFVRAIIYKSGNVYYSGNPSGVEEVNYSSGKLIRM